MTHLYELTIQYKAIRDAIEADEGLMTDEQMEALLDIECGTDEKVANTVRLMEELALSADSCDTAAAKLIKKRNARRNKIEWLRRYLLNELIGQDRMSAGDDTHGATRVPGRLSVADLPDGHDLEGIPDEYLEFKTLAKLKKKMVLDAAKDDEDTAPLLGNLPSGGALEFGGCVIKRGPESLKVK